MFEISGKIALISGGASGIGLRYTKELLRNKLRGVTIADINEQFGKSALAEIEKEFGPNKAIFVKTDVTNQKNYEEAFKQTISKYKNLDIVINNAGILNDTIWEKELLININGTIHGTLLALENYIPKYKTGSEGVIVNISSIAGTEPFPMIPVYTATKFAVIGLSQSFGHPYHYEQTKVKILTICPGITDTPLISGMENNVTLGPRYQEMIAPGLSVATRQKPENVALGLMKIIQNAETGTVWVIENDQDPYEYKVANRLDMAPK